MALLNYIKTLNDIFFLMFRACLIVIFLLINIIGTIHYSLMQSNVIIVINVYKIYLYLYIKNKMFDYADVVLFFFQKC